MPSRAAKAAIASAARPSAHHQPKSTFIPRAVRIPTQRQPSKNVIDASASSGPLAIRRAVRRLTAARENMTTAVTAR